MSPFSRFLARWSRRKAAARAMPAPVAATLDADGDLTAALGEEVAESVRRQALKRLFSDPRLNVMDGLDVYIDDYSIADPIPKTLLAQLHQARLLADEDGKAQPSQEDPPDRHPASTSSSEEDHDEHEGQTDRTARGP